MTNAGGAAAGAGIEFQARATAWWIAQMLAEAELDSAFEIKGRVVAVRCESTLAVDDILIEVVDDSMRAGALSCQAKRKLNLDEEFASVGEQFARQYLENGARPQAANHWEQPLRAGRDAMVLITTSESSRAITVSLPAVLRRIRGSVTTTEAHTECAKNADEAKALAALVESIQRCATSRRREVLSEQELKVLLSFVHVQVLALDDDGADARTTIGHLSLDAVDVDEAKRRWSELVKIGTAMIGDRDRNDRARLLRRVEFAAVCRAASLMR